MATTASPMPAHTSVKPAAASPLSYQNNHIDRLSFISPLRYTTPLLTFFSVTSDDDEDDIDTNDYSRFTKRPRIDPPKPAPTNHYPMAIPASGLRNPSNFQPYAPSNLNPIAYRPAFAPSSSSFNLPRQYQSPQQQQQSASPRIPSGSSARVIDLTGSPSPPPVAMNPPPVLSADLPPKTPVCIGQLGVTALVLYPVPYLLPTATINDEWASVRLQYEHNPNKPGGGAETIHIKAPQGRAPNGEQFLGEAFGVVEQKVATALGPMLGKGLIRLDAKVRKGPPNLPILPLQMLVYTPKGNIPVVGNYLHQCGLLLDHPSPPYEMYRLVNQNQHYYNPHNPPPGGHRAQNRLYPQVNNANRWSTPQVSGKSVEVQRSQVDELFKSLKSGDELMETEPSPDVATKLYPHQKKALTFLLEREREKPGSDGKFSSLWQPRTSSMTNRTCWVHAITTKEVFQEPKETKGAILADDMGLGKTITCVSLIAATLASAREFAAVPSDAPSPPRSGSEPLSASHFAGSVWGMPEDSGSMSAKAKAKVARVQDKLEAEHARASRIKTKSRASLIICPLSTVSNWEDQFREHWRGEVSVVGGAGGCVPATASQAMAQALSQPSMFVDGPKPSRIRDGAPLRVYIYHGTARKPDPAYLADFDAVITTYATLASEFSKQNKSIASAEADDDDDDGGSSDGGGVEIDERGNQVLKLPKAKKGGMKRKKSGFLNGPMEAASALQSIHWFRVVLDEAHSIKETGTVGSRACCDLMADRRLCLTGTPVQNKLDDVFALIKFLRLDPLDDKNIWTEYIGSPVKFGQSLGVARLQMIMKCITLRRTKESKTQDGTRILDLPPRRDELRYLKFDAQEQSIYDQFFNESKAEFDEMTDKNEVMKNYVGILQKILRLRQICDHFELVEGKGPELQQDSAASYEEIIADISRDGINVSRAAAVFAILRESATTQCVECGAELCSSSDISQADAMDVDGPSAPKRARKAKGSSSRGPTRASSPSTPRPILTRCQHLFCIECYRNCICPGWPNVAPDTRRSCSACQTGLCPSDAVEIKPDAASDPTVKKKHPKREKRQKGLSLENFHPSTKVKALLGDLVQFSRANPYSGNYDSDSIEVQMVDNEGNQLDDGVVKTVVFSQWTSMLDKIEDALEAAGIRYDRLDGTMKRDDRTRAMDALKHDPGCEVLLVSLKAGGVGLNLTAAQRVYLMDPYWNPAVENQAVDRIHRLGQTRPVTTVKLIIENSIEARLLEVQRKKTELANMTLGQNFSKAEMMSRRMEELNELFG
ncbi:SNF2 family N-terminal domain-containing protein [Mycena maculata]|uniref:SNF2 family N-terminal domain-containing protein n=1 Tax=Mycena maculata TaxID=230809 RepID=A0AAD7KDR8_9AGAR|nr:SNF2 family N-terminal domain-containing protein [Mycena maculata]